jgi:hypothetical protein
MIQWMVDGGWWPQPQCAVRAPQPQGSWPTAPGPGHWLLLAPRCARAVLLADLSPNAIYHITFYWLLATGSAGSSSPLATGTQKNAAKTPSANRRKEVAELGLRMARSENGAAAAAHLLQLTHSP